MMRCLFGCCKTYNDEKIHINKKTIIRDQIDIAITNIDNLLKKSNVTIPNNEEKYEEKQLFNKEKYEEKQSSNQVSKKIRIDDIRTIQDNVKNIYKSKLVTDYKIILTSQSFFPLRKNKPHQCCPSCCICNCKSNQCPTYHGCDCKECGCGSNESWAYQCNPHPCPLICCSLCCAGIQLYLYQWIISPFLICDSNTWECDNVLNCQCALYEYSKKEKALEEVNEYVSTPEFIDWATSLKTSLILLKKYVDENTKQDTIHTHALEPIVSSPPLVESMK